MRWSKCVVCAQGLFFFPPVPSECAHLGECEQDFCMKISFHDELSFLSTEGGCGVRTGWTQPISYPSFNSSNSSQKFGCFQSPSLSLCRLHPPAHPIKQDWFPLKTPQWSCWCQKIQFLIQIARIQQLKTTVMGSLKKWREGMCPNEALWNTCNCVSWFSFSKYQAIKMSLEVIYIFKEETVRTLWVHKSSPPQ